jgi:signal transduction histidine kinase
MPAAPAIGLLRRKLVASLSRPIPEVVDVALECTTQALAVRAAVLARRDGASLEVLDSHTRSGDPILSGTRIRAEDAQAAPIVFSDGHEYGALAVLTEGKRPLTEAESDWLNVAAALMAGRIEAGDTAGRPDLGGRTGSDSATDTVMRMATTELQEPLAVLRGYADMLSREEVPAEQLPLVARRLVTQSQAMLRVVDHLVLLARLPLQLSFTVRVSLHVLAQAAADAIREQADASHLDVRLQLDASGDVWGDPVLLQAALNEMLQNVFTHAASATTVQLRLRQSARDRFQLIVKDDGPGISAADLGELFGPLSQPGGRRLSRGLGLYLVRQVAEAHGGSAWANSLEGKGTTFYLELPGASPDGRAARVSLSDGQASAG